MAEETGRAESAELDRLMAAVKDYRARMLARAESFMAENPPEVVPALTALQKDFKGTALAADVDAKLAEARKSADLRASITIWKSYRKTMKRLEKMDEPSAKTRAKAAAKLEKLIAGHESLPVTETVRAAIAELR